MTSYWRSVASVLTGSATAQIIPILGSVIIARQFAPSEFGLFSAWLGTVLLLAVLLPCRFEMALAIEKDGEPRRLDVISILLSAILVSCVVGIFLVLGIVLFPNLRTGFPFVLVIVGLPTAFAIAISNVWQAWAAAEGLYRQLSVIRIAQASAITFIQIIVGLFWPSAGSLAVAHLAGVTFSVLVAIYLLPLGRLAIKESINSLRAFWWRWRYFPVFSLPAGLINTAAAQLPIIIVASRFGADTAGLLALAIKVLGAPSGLLGKSVLDVFKRHAAIAFKERGECRREYLKTLYVLASLALIFCVGIVFLSEMFFSLAFGNAWRGAGTIAVWLSPLFAMRFIASPLSYMVYIVGKQHFDLSWQVALFCTTVVGLYSFNLYSEALQVYSLTCGALYAVYLWMSYRFSSGGQ
ncbi:oligosaccharide flippase family protein [Pseudomonas sp. KSR10]|uniref:oligosaccharide flippase family protein n=1 Tax=Pseudomonas sp. KSR10 TaxID=2916654 RepID=UPI001EF841CB|nr:oligosaccharide flippase family protein [Pseudomonas sp. KSR10]MCG6542263.1 oligosaccharide flippase family protein [Pseudomonas sp. KSR10]